MLENADQQQVALASTEEHDFLTTVRDGIVTANPELGDDPTLLGRLASTYGEAKRLGLTAQELLVEFLYLEIKAPSFYRHPEISTWLEKPGASIDDRFKDLLDVLHKKLDHIQGA